MSPLNLYQHKNCADMAIRSLKKYWIPEKQGWKIKVEYWNIGCTGNPWYLGVKETVFINKSDWLNWKLVY